VPGLTSPEATHLLASIGRNEVVGRQPGLTLQFAARFWGPVPWMLEAAALLQLVRGERTPALVIASLLLFNATLGWFREQRATRAVAALQERLALTAEVHRDGAWSRLLAALLVPGDVVRLSLGAIVPADVRITDGTLQVDQSTLTGESLPVDRGPGETAFAGSLVRRGQAVGEVIATGPRTYYGTAIELVARARGVSSEQKAVLSATRRLALLNGSVAICLLAYAAAIALPLHTILDLAITVLLASIPVALPATFTLAGAIAAQSLARQDVLLTRLTAAFEAASLTTLCSDKTGTLTRNVLQVVDVVPMQGYTATDVLRLAAAASSESDADVIDATLRKSFAASAHGNALPSIRRFVPFDPSSKIAEADIVNGAGNPQRVIKGALGAIEPMISPSREARDRADALTNEGHRVLAVAAGAAGPLQLVGLVALSDPPREEAREIVARLSELGIRTLMLTGDATGTARSVARQVGIPGRACSVADISAEDGIRQCGVFARVNPGQKYQIVQALQREGDVVGMCGDGINDAPALRQAQLGIAVSTATDGAKAAAGMVLTRPGLRGVLVAVEEGRKAFQRVQTYTLNMMTKKLEIVLFLASGPVLFHQPVLTPTLMVLMMVTNDFLSMSLTTDQVIATARPARWVMSDIVSMAAIFAIAKLMFSVGIVAAGKWIYGIGAEQLQALAFVTLVLGNQALLFAVRGPEPLRRRAPGRWVVIACIADVAISQALAGTGTLMARLPTLTLGACLVAAGGLTLLFEAIKRPVFRLSGLTPSSAS